MSPRRHASYYGHAAERWARRRYGLESDHDGHHDARTADGEPVETKAAMLNRASGKRGRFRIFERPHSKLRQADGIYVFIAYRANRGGMVVERARTLRAADLDLRFYSSGGHRDSRQVKIAPTRIFG